MGSTQKWGIIGGIGMIVIQLIIYMGSFMDTSIGNVISIVNYLLLIGIIVMATLETRTAQGGFLNYGKAFVTGLLTSILAAVLIGVFMYLYLKFLDHHIINTIHDKIAIEMEKRDMPDNSREIALKYAKMATWPGSIALSTFFSISIIGLIFSLIIGAIVKREGPPTFLNANEPGMPAQI